MPDIFLRALPKLVSQEANLVISLSLQIRKLRQRGADPGTCDFIIHHPTLPLKMASPTLCIMRGWTESWNKRQSLKTMNINANIKPEAWGSTDAENNVGIIG